MGRTKQDLIFEAARDVLNRNPATSDRIRQEIVSRGRRHVPTAREITFALRSSREFILLDKVDASSLSRVRSHQVNLWGLRGRNY